MIAGDVSLPFLADGVFIPADLGVGDLSDFDRVFEVIEPLIGYVTPRSSGQIVCGTAVGPDPDGAGPVEGIPTGALRNLDPNQAVYCRAYTSQNGTASWTANGTPAGGAATTIGVEPTTNIALTANGSGDFAVEVAVHARGRFGRDHDPASARHDPGTPGRARCGGPDPHERQR